MSIDKNSIILKYFHSEIKDYFLFTHGITLSQTIHSCRFQKREVTFCRNINDRLVTQIRLLTNPKILNIGWGYASIFYFNCFSRTFSSFNLCLSIQFFCFKISTSFFYFNLTILLCLANSAFPSISCDQTLYHGRTKAITTKKATMPPMTFTTNLTRDGVIL